MRIQPTPCTPVPLDTRLVLPALLGAASLSLFAAGYWLADFLPVGSRWMVAVAALVALLAAAVFYWLLDRLGPTVLSFGPGQRVLLLLLSFLGAAAVLFGGTGQWRSEARYVPFFLPSHQLKVSLQAQPGVQPAAPARLVWFNTSLGDVSYDALRLRGWERDGDELVLQNPADNQIAWSGRTGGAAQLLFRNLPAGSKLNVAWDGREQPFVESGAGKVTVESALSIPWYASRPFLLVLGLLGLLIPAGAVLALTWQRRLELASMGGDFVAGRGWQLDRLDALWIAALILLALALRLPRLGVPFPAVDEYYHLIAARQLTEGATLGSVYPRGLWLVTVPVSLALRVFGYQLWAARMVGAFINALAVVPLYLLCRRMNRPIAVLAAALFATSPWTVTFARMAREYAFYPFYFYWIALGMLAFIESVPRDFVAARDARRFLNGRTILLGAALVLPPLIALYGDRLSTFRTIMIAYPVFGLFVLARFDLKASANRPVLAVLGAGLLAVCYFWYERQKAKILTFPSYNSVPVEYFLPDPQQQWYFEQAVPLVVVGLIATVVLAIALHRRNSIPAFFSSLWLTYLAFFALFSKTFFHTRHLSTTQLWYVVVVAIGLYGLWKGILVLGRWRGRVASAALGLALGLSVVNLSQLLVPVVSTDPDNPISEDYLHDLTQVHGFMLDHAQPGDVLISTVYGFYASWKEEPQFEAKYRITTQTPPEAVLALIRDHPSGWIVMDHIRLAMSPLDGRVLAAEPDVKLVGTFGDETVWRWQHPASGLGSRLATGKGP